MNRSDDAVDAHAPTSRGHRPRIPVPVRSHSRSFFEALDSIDRGASASDAHLFTRNPQPPHRHHKSMGHIDVDVSPDSVACATLFRRIMSEGINETSDSPKVTQSSFHASSRTTTTRHRRELRQLSFQSTSSSTTSNLDIDDLLSQNSPPESKKKGKGKSVAPFPSPPLTPSNEHGKSRLTQKPKESEKDQACVPMKVSGLHWIDHRGVSGRYSGQVNSLIQPHGHGSLVLTDGTTITSKWCNGTSLDRRRSSIGATNEKPARGLKGKSISWKGPTEHKAKECHDYQQNHKHTVRLDESNRTDESADSTSKHISSNGLLSKPSSKNYPYQLGEAPISSAHMIDAPTVEKAISNADSLKIHDFAFIRRSNGEWCYSIVAKKNRSPEAGKNGRHVEHSEDESILFVTNAEGSTKCIKKKHWGTMIRLVRHSDAKV
ncbi:hypothetical protein HJC23_002233 [Cyclotella cryptica]|uniref:Uncharacterized protein n=1 Tax=Cyclotella cryptica TaxID=29204 RepID=A0ABD3QFU9_9STRA